MLQLNVGSLYKHMGVYYRVNDETILTDGSTGVMSGFDDDEYTLEDIEIRIYRLILEDRDCQISSGKSGFINLVASCRWNENYSNGEVVYQENVSTLYREKPIPLYLGEQVLIFLLCLYDGNYRRIGEIELSFGENRVNTTDKEAIDMRALIRYYHTCNFQVNISQSPFELVAFPSNEREIELIDLTLSALVTTIESILHSARKHPDVWEKGLILKEYIRTSPDSGLKSHIVEVLSDFGRFRLPDIVFSGDATLRDAANEDFTTLQASVGSR